MAKTVALYGLLIAVAAVALEWLEYKYVTRFFATGDSAGLDSYSARALARVWKSERFSWYLTNLMHRFPNSGAFERRMQIAELSYIASSRAAQTAIAENYVGLPL